MKDDDTRILDGEVREDGDTKILNPADKAAGESTVVIDGETRFIDEKSEPTQMETPQPKTQPLPLKTAKKSNKWVVWLVGLLVLAGAGVGTWCLFGDSSTDINAQADHSDDDEFENFGRVRRAVEENVSERSYKSAYEYEANPDYYVEEVAPVEAPASDYDYYEVATPADSVAAVW